MRILRLDVLFAGTQKIINKTLERGKAMSGETALYLIHGVKTSISELEESGIDLGSDEYDRLTRDDVDSLCPIGIRVDWESGAVCIGRMVVGFRSSECGGFLLDVKVEDASLVCSDILKYIKLVYSEDDVSLMAFSVYE